MAEDALGSSDALGMDSPHVSLKHLLHMSPVNGLPKKPQPPIVHGTGAEVEGGVVDLGVTGIPIGTASCGVDGLDHIGTPTAIGGTCAS